MFGDYKQEFQRKLVDFVVFGVLGIVEFLIVLYAMTVVTPVLGLSAGPAAMMFSAAVMVAATILAGGMPLDN